MITMNRVRRAKAEDVQGLVECQAQVLESLRGMLPARFIEAELDWLRAPDREDDIVEAIEAGSMIALVAEEAGSIVGFAQGKVDRGGTSWLAYLGVAPAFRRRSVARELVEGFIAESRARGARRVNLYAAQELEPAIRLYADMGFGTDGRIRRSRHGVDLRVYSKTLDHDAA